MCLLCKRNHVLMEIEMEGDTDEEEKENARKKEELRQVKILLQLGNVLTKLIVITWRKRLTGYKSMTFS